LIKTFKFLEKNETEIKLRELSSIYSKSGYQNRSLKPLDMNVNFSKSCIKIKQKQSKIRKTEKPKPEPINIRTELQNILDSIENNELENNSQVITKLNNSRPLPTTKMKVLWEIF
jgi:hypothetical protein